MDCKRAMNSKRGLVVHGNLINFHCMSPDKLLLNCMFAFLAVFWTLFFTASIKCHRQSPKLGFEPLTFGKPSGGSHNSSTERLLILFLISALNV